MLLPIAHILPSPAARQQHEQKYVLSYNWRMSIRHVDHIGINVIDLDPAKQFFVDLGFRVLGSTHMRSELLDRVTGLHDVHTELITLEAPDGQLNLELVKYHHPADPAGIQPPASNTLGLRHLAFQVDDLQGIVDRLQRAGHQLVGDIQIYEDVWKLCYIRGPEGIILELAEAL
jgi:catechol 2,3-dioxygenase-like lactoylglutathione lyase family enzyme